MSDVQRIRGNFVAGMDLSSRALALDPDNPEILNTNSVTLAQLGYLKQAIPVRQHLQTLEPLVPLFKGNFATMLWASGQTDAANALAPDRPGQMGALILASQGRYSEAADRLQSFRTDDPVLSVQRDDAVRLLRTAPAVSTSPETLPKLGLFGQVYAYVGAAERVLEYHEGGLKIGYMGGMEVAQLWAPPFAPVRKTERFKTFVREAGFVTYWRAKGWPDLCRPLGADDFVCD
jgi:adenylate cyclase